MSTNHLTNPYHSVVPGTIISTAISEKLDGLHQDLILECMNGNTVKIDKILIGNDKIDINETDIYGRRPLIEACYAGQLKSVELLLSLPTVDVNVKDYMGRTPLNTSLRLKHKKIVEVLLKRKEIKIDEKSANIITSLI